MRHKFPLANNYDFISFMQKICIISNQFSKVSWLFLFQIAVSQHNGRNFGQYLACVFSSKKYATRINRKGEKSLMADCFHVRVELNAISFGKRRSNMR